MGRETKQMIEEDRVNSDTDIECECDGECWNCIYEDECNQDE